MPKGIDDLFLEKAFKYQGFKPISRVKIVDQYCYIMSNRLINGKTYVYPEPLTNNYNIMVEDNLRDIHKVFDSGVGIPGYTKIRYGNTKI